MKTCKFKTFSTRCFNQCEGNTDYCATHNRMIRKTNNSKSIRKKYAKPNKISDKRKEINKEYFILVEQFKKDNPHCKAKVNEYCTKSTDDPHHKFGRGIHLLDVSTWLPVCRNCHVYIESHPQEAKEKGWSSSRLQKENPVI